MFGKDPQSEKVVDQFDCAIAWMPTTSIEGAQMTRQMTATLDQHRSEMQENLGRLASVIKQGAQALFTRPVVLLPHEASADNGDKKS